MSLLEIWASAVKMKVFLGGGQDESLESISRELKFRGFEIATVLIDSFKLLLSSLASRTGRNNRIAFFAQTRRILNHLPAKQVFETSNLGRQFFSAEKEQQNSAVS